MVGGNNLPDQELSDAEYLKHPKYGAFFEDVINVLKAFDRAKEWADLIKCLQRLQKALQKYPSFPLVPAKLTFAKRLSQCLNPALPGGVHLKALEMFEEIFVRIGVSKKTTFPSSLLSFYLIVHLFLFLLCSFFVLLFFLFLLH
jgi:hypothetical protein